VSYNSNNYIVEGNDFTIEREGREQQLVPVPDAPFEIAILVGLHKTVNGFSVPKPFAAVVVSVVGPVPSAGHKRFLVVVELPLDPERAVHHMVGHRALRQRTVELPGERHLKRIYGLVMVVVDVVTVVQVIVAVVVEPERVGFGERRRWPERLLLGGLRRAPVHVVVVVVGRRPYDYVRWSESIVVVDCRVETTSTNTATEKLRSAAHVLFVVAH